MPVLEAVDAKIERARSELRLLKADIAAFCEERARLRFTKWRDAAHNAPLFGLGVPQISNRCLL